jgi:hypothetical protein
MISASCQSARFQRQPRAVWCSPQICRRADRTGSSRCLTVRRHRERACAQADRGSTTCGGARPWSLLGPVPFGECAYRTSARGRAPSTYTQMSKLTRRQLNSCDFMRGSAVPGRPDCVFTVTGDHIVRRQRPPDPLNSNSPTGSTFTASSTLVSTRGLMRICPGLASSQSREATFDTVPTAA